MMKKSFILILALTFLFTFSNLFSEFYSLYIEDPDTRKVGSGSINNIEITAKPSGSYIEYEMIMYFDAFGGILANRDSTEIVFKFSTPQKSFIDDSWLWMGDTVIIADLIDRWTATLIYEDIVDRRKDPSLLLDNGNNNYSLNIYPLRANGFRKVKMKINVPATLKENELYAPLPLYFDRLYNSIRNNINFYIYENDDFGEPELVHLDESLNKVGFMHTASIDPNDFLANYEYGIKFNIKDNQDEKDYLFSLQEKDGDTYYQFISSLNFADSEVFKPRKMAIMIDFDKSKSNFTQHDVLFTLKYAMLKNMNPNDYFNVFVPGFAVTAVSTKWLKATESNINNVFDNIVPASISDYTDLPSLFNSAINFINENDNMENTPILTAMLVVSNTDEVGDNKVANELIMHIKNKLNMNVEIYTASFATHFKHYRIGGLYYSANDYFNWNITKQTGGIAEKLQDNNGSLVTMFAKQINYIFNSIENISFNTYTKDGFTHSKFTNSDMISVNKTTVFSEIGKLEMGLPFIAQINGFFRGEIFNKRFEIHDDDVTQEKYLLNRMWAAKKIEDYYTKDPLGNKQIHEIIDLSMENRVLSKYTAFLALEPQMQDTLFNNDPEEGDDDPLTVEDKELPETNIRAKISPNPFSSNVSIDISKYDLTNLSDIRIINLNGEIVKVFKAKEVLESNGRLEWDGFNEIGEEVPKGAYFVYVRFGKELVSLKIIKI